MKQDGGYAAASLPRKQVSNPPMAYLTFERRSGEIFRAQLCRAARRQVQNQNTASAAAIAAQRTLRVGQGMVYEKSRRLSSMAERGAVPCRTSAAGCSIPRSSQAIAPLIKCLGTDRYRRRFDNRYSWRGTSAGPSSHRCNSRDASVVGDPAMRSRRHGEDKTEFGELSRALERMRSSVKAAVIRLG